MSEAPSSSRLTMGFVKLTGGNGLSRRWRSGLLGAATLAVAAAGMVPFAASAANSTSNQTITATVSGGTVHITAPSTIARYRSSIRI